MEWPWQRKRREEAEARESAKKTLAEMEMARVHARSEEIRRKQEQEKIERRTRAAEERLLQAGLRTDHALEESLRTRHALCSMCDSVGKGHVVRDGAIICRSCEYAQKTQDDDEVIEVFELGSPTPVQIRVKRKRDVSPEDLEYVRRSLGLES